jgi:hypothetical protein
MARSKRQYGSGCLLKRGRGWAIRWRESEIGPDGTLRRTLKYEALGEATRKQAQDTLAERVARGGTGKQPTQSRVLFQVLANEWRANVVPMYKHSKVVAQLMGHAKVDTTLNVYTQVLDDSVRTAAGKIGSELFTIVH